MRLKYPDNPDKFMESESELDEQIKSLSALSAQPQAYPDFVKAGCVNYLVQLLAHENTDIAIDALEVIDELTGEDVEASDEQMQAIIGAIGEAQVLDLMVDNLDRLDEFENKSDQQGVYYTLSVLENIASGDPALAVTAFTDTSILSWLLNRLMIKEKQLVSQNKQYSAEILSIYINISLKLKILFLEKEGMECVLKLLSPYRNRDPEKGSDEEEYAENLFDILSSVVEIRKGKEALLQAEGVELLLIMLRQGKFSKTRALKCLDHACAGKFGLGICQRVVEAGGLKPLFHMFMNKSDFEILEHLLGIFSSCLRHLPIDSVARIRFVAKFEEKEHQKIDRLLAVRKIFDERVKIVDTEIARERAASTAEKDEERAPEWYLRRVEAGLYVIRVIDIILAWLCAENDETKAKVQALLKVDNGKSLSLVRDSLKRKLRRYVLQCYIWF